MLDPQTAEVLAAIDGLRHRSILRQDDIARWVGIVMQAEPERALWHVRRLDGVSCSSVYSYVADMRGTFDSYRAAREVDMQRLMMALPAMQNQHMLRGTMLEPVIRLVALSTFGAVSVEEARAAIAAQNGIPQCRSLRGNPDDVVRLPTGALEKWDYKAPALSKDDGDEPINEYVAQLHGYALLAGAAKVPIRGLKLVSLNCPVELANELASDLLKTQQTDPSRLAARQEEFAEILLKLSGVGEKRIIGLTQQPVRFDRQMAMDIIKAANLADERIQRGELAPWPRRPAMELSKNERLRGDAASIRLARLIALKKTIEREEGATRGELSELVKGKVAKGMQQPFPLISISARNSIDIDKAADFLLRTGVPKEEISALGDYDADKMREALAQQGVDVETFRRDPKPDEDAIKAHIEELGPDAKRTFCHETLAMGHSRAKTGKAPETLSAIAIEADSVVASLLGQSDQHDAGLDVDIPQDESEPSLSS